MIEIKDDLNTISWQNIFNTLQLYVLTFFFINIVIYLIKNILDFLLSSFFFFFDKEIISILDIIKIIYYIISV